jgi:ubiquinone biosynthesis protein Coq4
MPKIATLGNSATVKNDRYHAMDNIDIKGNGPISIKTWVLVGMAIAAFFVYKSDAKALK